MADATNGSEMMIERGEGLAGLRETDELREIGAALTSTNALRGRQIIGLATRIESRLKLLAALEAAAPAGTAPGGLFPLTKEQIERITARVQPQIEHEFIHGYTSATAQVLRVLTSLKIELDVLATPSPQAPQEQCNAFSTTSAREQSSATASDSPSAASFVKWARVVIQQLLTGIVFTPETKQNRPLMEFVEDAHEFMHETAFTRAERIMDDLAKQITKVGADKVANWLRREIATVPAATQEPAGNGATHHKWPTVRNRAEAEMLRGGSMAETKEQYEARMLMPDLCLRGKATDHIWLMEDVEGYIGIRMDCGDSGTVYLTHEQAKDLAQQIASLQPGSPRKVGEDGQRCCESGNFGEPHVCCKAPGNLPTNIADLRERLFRLDKLLCDPHPGLMTWCEAYGKAAANVLLFWDNSSAPMGMQK